jgi:hypothetical protein
MSQEIQYKLRQIPWDSKQIKLGKLGKLKNFNYLIFINGKNSFAK